MLEKPQLVLPLIAALVVGIISGCKSVERRNMLRMERTVPVASYKSTVDEMVKQIEKDNLYEALYVDDEIRGDSVNITVWADKMPAARSYQRKCIALQNENLELKSKVATLKKEIEKLKGELK